MKKSILILAAFAFVAFSCTKTEVKDDTPKKGINFFAYTAKPTKAVQTEVTTDNLDKFNVTAIGNGAIYFDNVTFKRITVWESDTKYFWPDYQLKFYAYNTPAATTEFDRSIDASSEPTLTVTPSPIMLQQEDLVAAYKSGHRDDYSNGNNPVDIRFSHYLTQIIVNALSSNDNYKVEVNAVKLAHIAKSGTYTFTTNTIVASDEKTNYSATFTSSKELTTTPKEVMKDGEDGGKWYLVPQTISPWNQAIDKPNANKGSYLALKVKITAKVSGAKIYPATATASGDEYAWMAVPIPAEFAFAMGKKYNVTMKFFDTGGAGYVDPEEPGDLNGNNDPNDDIGKSIFGGPIKFDATVDTWDTNKVEITISL